MGPCVKLINLLNTPSKKKLDQEWEELKDIFRKNNFTLTETSVDPTPTYLNRSSRNCFQPAETGNGKCIKTISNIKINIDDSTHVGGTTTLTSTDGTTENAQFILTKHAGWKPNGRRFEPQPFTQYELHIITEFGTIHTKYDCDKDTNTCVFVGRSERRIPFVPSKNDPQRNQPESFPESELSAQEEDEVKVVLAEVDIRVISQE